MPGVYGARLLQWWMARAGKSPEVFGDVDEGRAFFLNDPGSYFLMVWPRDFEPAVDV